MPRVTNGLCTLEDRWCLKSFLVAVICTAGNSCCDAPFNIGLLWRHIGGMDLNKQVSALLRVVDVQGTKGTRVQRPSDWRSRAGKGLFNFCYAAVGRLTNSDNSECTRLGQVAPLRYLLRYKRAWQRLFNS